MGFEPTTSCLGSTKDKRREPLASFLGIDYQSFEQMSTSEYVAMN